MDHLLNHLLDHLMDHLFYVCTKNVLSDCFLWFWALFLVLGARIRKLDSKLDSLAHCMTVHILCSGEEVWRCHMPCFNEHFKYKKLQVQDLHALYSQDHDWFMYSAKGVFPVKKKLIVPSGHQSLINIAVWCKVTALLECSSIKVLGTLKWWHYNNPDTRLLHFF